MNHKRSKTDSNERPANLDDREENIRSDEDYRIWCRSDGEQIVIRARKIYLQKHIQWIFEIGNDATKTIRRDGLRSPVLGVLRFPGHAIIKYIDSITETAPCPE